MTTKTSAPTPGAFNGRPTKYKPEFCAKVIELGKIGASRTRIAAELGISTCNLNDYEVVHEEFAAALKQARADAMEYFEKLAETHLVETQGGPKVNTGLFKVIMSARFPDTYRENTKVEVTGRDGNAVEVAHTHNFASELMDDLLAVRQANAKSRDEKP